MGRDAYPHAHRNRHHRFNPRARMGRDGHSTVYCILTIGFNPRARMGRDTLDILRIFNNQSFNPRARMGRDAGLSSESPEDSPFQSTRPHGARQISQGGYYIFNCFNPRARMGRDTGSNKKIIVAHVSIHAPAWGATWLQFTADVVAVFQSTRPHGARQQLFSHRPCQSRFQSTRPHGARQERQR